MYGLKSMPIAKMAWLHKAKCFTLYIYKMLDKYVFFCTRVTKDQITFKICNKSIEGAHWNRYRISAAVTCIQWIWHHKRTTSEMCDDALGACSRSAISNGCNVWWEKLRQPCMCRAMCALNDFIVNYTCSSLPASFSASDHLMQWCNGCRRAKMG